MILNDLIKAEKNININLYKSGNYWSGKNRRTIIEIKKSGLKNFRGISKGIGTSFADNLEFDAGNEFRFKGRLVRKIFSLPILNKVFKKQLQITKTHLTSYIINKAVVYKNNKNVLELIKKYKFENTTDFGSILNFENSGKNYSCHYLDMAHRIDKLSEIFDFKKINSYFEIGGGFGANTHFLIQNFPNIRKILYLDAVPNIYVGSEYLKNYYNKAVKDFSVLKNHNEITFSNNNDLEILCIPPWLIEKVNVEIDHFHNAASFVEMPKNVVNNYIKFVKKFKTKEISLISYDKFDTNTTFDPTELNTFFDNKLKICWINSLVEDYNRKEIYLTSS